MLDLAMEKFGLLQSTEILGFGWILFCNGSNVP